LDDSAHQVSLVLVTKRFGGSLVLDMGDGRQHVDVQVIQIGFYFKSHCQCFSIHVI
jgi:hypothetical protein